MNNLINNAVKFKIKGQDGLIVIRAKDNDEDIVISVEDKGKGLKKEDLDQVFNELFKSDWSRHDLKSNGLGLSICKRIIEKHGGRIWAESSGKNKGSTFSFTLPKKREI